MESIKYKISLIIHGDIGEYEDLAILNNYGVVKYRKKGELVSKVLPRLENDTFSFVYEVSEYSEEKLNGFFDIMKLIDINKYKAKGCDINIRLYIQSDYAQVQFVLPQNIIHRIEELGLDLYVSVLSWGGVDE